MMQNLPNSMQHKAIKKELRIQMQSNTPINR